MNGPVLVAYATKKGSTREVAEAIATTLRAHEINVDVQPASEAQDVAHYAAVVLGGALYTGRWHRDARRFLARHRGVLAGLPLAVFALGPRTLEESEVAQSRAQLQRALDHYPELAPRTIAIFGGVIDPAKLSFPLNRMPASDARDWNAIEAWTTELAARLVATRVPPRHVSGTRG
jgi:menaquinone-dependent protoporphyrinogen oxidase